MSQRHRTTLDHLLGSCVRARLLVSLLKEPGRRPWFRQLAAEAGSGISFVKHELAELERMGLVRSRRACGGLLFDAQPCHPLYKPLLDLIRACERIDAGEGPPWRDWTMPYEDRPIVRGRWW